MVYSINDNVVFGTAFSVPSYPTPTIKDIFDEDVSTYDAQVEANANSNRDASITNTCCEIVRNVELGKLILSKFREWVYRKNAELGITDNGITLLNSFYLIECALLAGMLSESSELILQVTATDVITEECKTKFSNACLSADHITI